MAHIEETPRKLTLKAGSTTLTLNKDSDKATLQQKMLLWNKKPVEFAIADIDDIAVKSDVDGLSGAPSITASCTGALARSSSSQPRKPGTPPKRSRNCVDL